MVINHCTQTSTSRSTIILSHKSDASQVLTVSMMQGLQCKSVFPILGGKKKEYTSFKCAVLRDRIEFQKQDSFFLIWSYIFKAWNKIGLGTLALKP